MYRCLGTPADGIPAAGPPGGTPGALGRHGIMEHPVTFAKEFAKLVRLVDERVDIPAQKAALRRCLAVLNSGAADLSADGDILFAGRSIVPPDADATALALRISSQSVATIAFELGAAPSDILATARWLVSPADSPLIAGMRTVRVDPRTDSDARGPMPSESAPTPLTLEQGAAPRRKSGLVKAVEALTNPRRKSRAIEATTPTAPRRKSLAIAIPETTPTERPRSGAFVRPPGPMPRRKSGISGTFPAFPGGRPGFGEAEQGPRTRATELLELLDRAGGSPEIIRVIDELVVTTEQAVRSDDRELVAEAMVGLLARQGDPRGGAVVAQSEAAFKRLATPASLRAIVQAAALPEARREGIQAVLAQAREAGAAALIVEVTIARTLAERRRYFEMLLKLPAAVGVLAKMLTSHQWYVVRNAAELLGQLHAAEAEAALVGALQHQDERVRRVVAQALTRLGTPGAVAALRGALVDPSPLVRVQAAGGLARRKGARSATTLTRALENEGNPEVQLAVIAALGRLGTPDAVSRLIGAAEPDGRLFKKKPVVFRVAAVHALGEIRTPAARAVLQSLAADKEREVREAVLRVVMHASKGELVDQS